MISDWELWACAQQVIQSYGKDADEHVAARVTALTLAGDEEGVRTWLAIADRVGQLGDYSGTGKRRH